MSLGASRSGEYADQPSTAIRLPHALHVLFGQFGCPSGPLGRLAGWLMARTDDDDRWVVELLNVRPDDRVLEVGFGPGVTIGLLAERVALVAGADPSAVMVRQASERNRAAIQAGRVELRHGVAEALPWPDGHFTKACALHVVYFWPSLGPPLRELHRVLALSGMLVLAVRLRRARAGRLDLSRYGYTDAQIAGVVAAVQAVGFREVTMRRRELGRQTIAAIIARR